MGYSCTACHARGRVPGRCSVCHEGLMVPADEVLRPRHLPPRVPAKVISLAAWRARRLLRLPPVPSPGGTSTQV